MAVGTPFRSLFTFLALGVMVAAALVMINLDSRTETTSGEGAVSPTSLQDWGSRDPWRDQEFGGTRSQAGSEPGLSSDPEPTRAVSAQERTERVLPAQETCADAGYLCAALASEGSLQLIRWPRNTRRILVLVPEPAGLPGTLAYRFQRAAIRGIQTWHNHPIPLLVRDRAGTDPPQIQVEWAHRVEDGRLGRAGVMWRKEGGRVQFQVEEFVLATHDPQARDRLLDPALVELVAAHEMGHALGLPHSDDPRDVMFPENTATRLTVRDFRTVEALYRLPNGGVIRR